MGFNRQRKAAEMVRRRWPGAVQLSEVQCRLQRIAVGERKRRPHSAVAGRQQFECAAGCCCFEPERHNNSLRATGGSAGGGAARAGR